MKKIINGKVYDTETAKEIAQWENQGSWRDYDHMEETLYRKRTGEFFIYGEGGPKTRYAESEGQNCWTGGCKIIPLSWEAAREWAEEHLDADEYLEHFTASESDEKIAISVYLPQSKLDQVKIEASKAGMSLSDYIVSKL